MSKQRFTAIAVAMALFAAPAQASNTFSGSYVAPSYEYDDIKIGSGFKVAFDHRFEQSPLRLELAYIDAQADIEGTSLALGYEGLDLSLSYLVPTNPGSDSAIWLGAGFYNGDATVEHDSFGFDESASGLSLGIGADWMPTPTFGFRFEYKVMVAMEDFADDANLDLFSIGLVVAFGKDERRSDSEGGRRHAIKSRPLPPAPPAPPAPPLFAGDTVLVGPAGGTLHQRHGGTSTLPAGTPVELVSARSDGGHAWWWVKAGGDQGWLLQSEIAGQ